MGLRGYVLAADQRFLVPYNFGVQQTDFHFNRLLKLTADNPRHQERLNALKPVLDQKLAHARETIALRDTQGLEAAQRDVASGRGQSMTDTIRLALQDIDQDEGSVLYKRSQAAAKASDINTFAVVTGFGFGFVLVVFTGFLLFRANTRAAAAAGESRNRATMLNSVLHSVADGVAVTDPSGTFLAINPAAEKFFGVDANGAPASELKTQWLRPEQRTPFPADQLPMPRALRGESVSDLEILIRNSAYPTGVVLSMTARPLLDDLGAITGAVLVAREVPHRKPAAEPAPKKIQESAPKPVLPNPVLPAAAQPKPVAQPVQPKVEPAPKTETTTFARRPSSTGTTVFERRPPSLNSVVEQAVATLQPAATLQQIALSQQLATNLPDAKFDAAAITEILNNLLTNALKHTPFGGSILVTTRQPSPDVVHIAVTDNGPGITADRHERIFDRDQTRTGGTGLSTCREIVQGFGGKIWVESETGKGSTFTFSLPVNASAAVPAAAASAVVPAKTEAPASDVSPADVEDIIQQLPWNKNKAA